MSLVHRLSPSSPRSERRRCRDTASPALATERADGTAGRARSHNSYICSIRLRTMRTIVEMRSTRNCSTCACDGGPGSFLVGFLGLGQLLLLNSLRPVVFQSFRCRWYSSRACWCRSSFSARRCSSSAARRVCSSSVGTSPAPSGHVLRVETKSPGRESGMHCSSWWRLMPYRPPDLSRRREPDLDARLADDVININTHPFPNPSHHGAGDRLPLFQRQRPARTATNLAFFGKQAFLAARDSADREITVAHRFPAGLLRVAAVSCSDMRMTRLVRRRRCRPAGGGTRRRSSARGWPAPPKQAAPAEPPRTPAPVAVSPA